MGKVREHINYQLLNNTDYNNLDTLTTFDVLNVRNGRSTSATIIGQLTKGTKVKIDQKIGDWYSIYYGQHGGFVYAQYLQV